MSDFSEESDYDVPEGQSAGYPTATNTGRWTSPNAGDLKATTNTALHTAFARRLLHTGPDSDTGGGRWR